MKPFFLVTVSAAALTLGAGLLARHRSRKAARAGPQTGPRGEEAFGPEARELTRKAIQFFILPIWMAAGAADWWQHRASDIQDTAGAKETLIHLLMLAEGGVPVMAGLLLEIDPLVLSVMIAGFFLHEATAMWDVSYAVTVREVKPAEQHAHSFLEMVPLMALVLVSLANWPQLKALAGLRVDPQKRLRLKKEPLGPAYVLGALGSMFVIDVLPYLEELLRDWRAHPGRLVPTADGPLHA
jgi:hypothetical protein